MQTLSSARRTCMASASATEWTATVRMPISRQARWMRSAISPRLAIRIFSNISCDALGDDHQRLTELNRLTILNQYLRDRPRMGRGDRIHHLHGLDDENGLALGDAVTDLHEGGSIRFRRQIGGAD